MQAFVTTASISSETGTPCASGARISFPLSHALEEATHSLVVPDIRCMRQGTEDEGVPRILRLDLARSTSGFAESLAMSSPSSRPACEVRTNSVRRAKKYEVGWGRRVVR